MARASSRSSSRKKSNSISIDLSKVEGRVNFTEGDHLLEVVEVTQEEGQKAPYLSWQFRAVEGESEGAVVYNNTSLSEQSLWNLRTCLEALGVEIPDDEFDLDFDELVGLTMMGSIELETYEGKKRPRLTDFWAAEEAVEEKPAKKARGAKAKAEEDEPEEKPKRGAKAKAKAEPEITEEDVNDMSEDELGDVIEEHKLDVDLDDFKTLRKQRAAVIDALQEAGVLTDEEAEEAEPEEEKPARRSRSRRGAAAEEAEPEEEEEKPARTRRRRAR